jgi:hypothetical protein
MKRIATIALSVLLLGCSTSPVTNQHPAWVCNAAYAGPLAGAIASLITADPMSLLTAVQIGVNGCQAEASLVNGPPAQITQTTTTVQGMTGAAAPVQLQPTSASLAQPQIVAPVSQSTK